MDDAERTAEAVRGFVPSSMRKVAFAGLGALFMTEEGIRSLAGQLKLPKEALGFVLSQAEQTKDEVGRVLSEELRRFLRSDKLRDEFLQLLSGMRVEVTAQVRLVPRRGAQAGGEPSRGPRSRSTERPHAGAAEEVGVMSASRAAGAGRQRPSATLLPAAGPARPSWRLGLVLWRSPLLPAAAHLRLGPTVRSGASSRRGAALARGHAARPRAEWPDASQGALTPAADAPRRGRSDVAQLRAGSGTAPSDAPPRSCDARRRGGGARPLLLPAAVDRPGGRQ